MDVGDNIVFYVNVKYLVHNILRKNASDIHLFECKKIRNRDNICIYSSFEIVLLMYIYILL